MAEALEAGMPEKTLEKANALMAAANDRSLNLATAESCTGGLLAALLTDLPGYSHVFERGFVVYSKQAKCDLLGIDRTLVDDCGAVSRTVAIAMARGAIARSDADIAASITGFAGPGDEDSEEGLVHLACARRDGPVDHRECHFGAIGRAGIRHKAIDVALGMMIEAVGR